MSVTAMKIITQKKKLKNPNCLINQGLKLPPPAEYNIKKPIEARINIREINGQLSCSILCDTGTFFWSIIDIFWFFLRCKKCSDKSANETSWYLLIKLFTYLKSHINLPRYKPRLAFILACQRQTKAENQK